jgi:DNA repair photolyase
MSFNESMIESNNIISFPLTSMPSPLAQPAPLGPIESQMRATLATLKDSRYPDSFDWSVYDRIASTFPEAPRGGVVFNTTFKLVNHHLTCTKCHYSFEIDSYGRGCFHNCSYCYAKDQLETHGFWNRPQPFPVNLAEVRKVFYTVFETQKASKWREIMERRVPIRVGSMSDSFMWLDTKYGVTQELLKIFNYYKYPYIIFTRSDLVAHDDYLPLIDPKLGVVQMSIVGNNHRIIRFIEPGAPSYRRRLTALKKLYEAGIWTTVRVNPLFPRHPDGYLTDKDSVIARFGSAEQIPVLDLYDDDFIPELAEAKVPSLLAGFVRLSSRAVNNMSKASGIDVRSFFRPDYLAMRGDKRYSDREIAAYYKLFADACKSNGVRFTTCYIGNGLKDYFQYQNLWDNKKDCCDVIGNVKAFQTTSQSIDWSFRMRQAPCKPEAEKAQALDAAVTQEYKSTGQVLLTTGGGTAETPHELS